jgi:hypothetical protein
MSLLSGESFQTICDITWTKKEKLSFHTSLSHFVKCFYFEENINEIDINTGLILFVYTEYIPIFIEKILPLRTKSFVLVSHNSDDGITNRFIPFLENPLLLHMFSQNTEIIHPKLTAIPIGIANTMWRHGTISHFNDLLNNVTPFNQKKSKIYVNINVNTNFSHRSQLLHIIQNNSLTQFVYPYKDHPSYLRELSEYKWVCSPRGNGVDCHRLWESLYANCIPLVDDTVNTSDFKKMGLPIIIVTDWSKINLEWLEEETEKIKKNDFHSELLFLEYWNRKFNSK